MFKNVCIVGGGNLGHVIAGWLANKGLNVSLLTRRPLDWSSELVINTPDNKFTSKICKISSKPEEVIPSAEIVLLTVPGYANKTELKLIKPYLNDRAYVGGVFCSSGFFFEALKILPENIKLWGFQRVPFIARTVSYGHEVNLLGYRSEFNIAVERDIPDGKENLRQWVECYFGSKTILRNNYFEVSITNSNSILHTARLYSMFSQWTKDKRIDRNISFYKEWSLDSAKLLIEMDKELFKILKYLPVSSDCLIPMVEYYDSHDAESLKNKILSISAFKDLAAPMKQDEKGWYPDYSSRYFIEDFGYSLRYIWELGKKYNVEMPNIDKVYQWGIALIK